jgi:hypothetical protein
MIESISHQVASTPGPFNNWVFDIISPWIKGRVLEIGSTPDSISTILIQKGIRIHLSTPDKAMREQLKARYLGLEIVRHVHSINFHRRDFDLAYPEETVKIFDTVLALNEPCDPITASNARCVLRKRGRLILLAPAYTAIYNGLEEDAEDWKRYNRKSINKLVTDNMEILFTRYYNLGGLSVLAVASKKNNEL